MATTEAAPQGIGVRDLLEAGLHFGHQTKRWNPKMKRYIFDKRNGIHIIDLAKSLVLLNAAMDFVHTVVRSGRSVLFVGTKKQAQQIIKETAEQCSQHYITHRWLGGTLTNRQTILQSIRRMREIEALGTSGELAKMHKKEAANLNRELAKLQRNLTGIANMADLPGALFVVDINREAIAVAEANRLGIPVVAIVDTNCDPDPVNYVIPGNDDAIRAVRLICGLAAETVRNATAEYEKKAAELARKRADDRAAALTESARPAPEAEPAPADEDKDDAADGSTEETN